MYLVNLSADYGELTNMQDVNLPVSRQPELRRYTDVTALLYMLRRSCLTLLNTALWDDRNDSHYIDLYREKKKLGSVLALCFTETGETYHHWKVFSPGTSGVCIRFKKDLLIEHLTGRRALRLGMAQYEMLDNMRSGALAIDDLPFLKRYAFRDEREFRLLFESRTALKSKDIPIPLDCIDRVTINPWLNVRLADAIFDTVRELEGCTKLCIGQSSLLNNGAWRKLGAGAE
jgi:hypothetical protein